MRVTVEDKSGGSRLDRYLVLRFPGASRATIMKYLKEGRARLNGRRARPGLHVAAGDDLELPDFEDALDRIRSGTALDLPAEAQRRIEKPGHLPVIYEDEDIVVVDKPAGLVMHPGEGHDAGLDDLLREHFGPSTRLVHRLDRDTSGVVIAARGHPRSARRLADAFKDGDVEKTYLALVRGIPNPSHGTVDAPLLNTRRPGESVRVDRKGSQAVTGYETVEVFAQHALLRCRPKTGRRHQIRVHLAHLGHPLAVDHVYARQKRLRLSDLRPDLPRTWKNPVVLNRQPLHAESLRLRHPASGEDVTFRAPLAQDIEHALDVLRAEEKEPGGSSTSAES
ncbi:MAG: RluA family pseudouridine synthase [Planctomycetota bacterium]|nr:RluA family pseudouridine synthase [Planctomycetota bacterium]